MKSLPNTPMRTSAVTPSAARAVHTTMAAERRRPSNWSCSASAIKAAPAVSLIVIATKMTRPAASAARVSRAPSFRFDASNTAPRIGTTTKTSRSKT